MTRLIPDNKEEPEREISSAIPMFHVLMFKNFKHIHGEAFEQLGDLNLLSKNFKHKQTISDAQNPLLLSRKESRLRMSLILWCVKCSLLLPIKLKS